MESLYSERSAKPEELFTQCQLFFQAVVKSDQSLKPGMVKVISQVCSFYTNSVLIKLLI